ncbi:hypothetical protein EJ04DRAFT_551452 [Polyplosphaeria fusca]|uniref:RING-type domain-containing protein n=1 Tax=Polyplosphaeria fusca TaxID=682080 RepID=A0A9P4R3A2_9PLEO|nr:hypothetical protein EJ04DRAFT_551452 [Polyplosphaeria fusca]
MAEGERTGLVDLEKELTCSICTDILYQPLTLLDCLHTFCGACLKEWFAFQASTATSIHPYTCPSCRASVRSTQPNATVTTLLDMYLKANPDRGKTEQDMKNSREKYKPGDNVLPKLRRREDPAQEEERRLIEQAQESSLREAGIITATSSLEPPRERRRRERSRERSRESGHSGREARSRSRTTQEENAARRRGPAPSRQVEHQSSLRSLLSASELDSQEIEEEIMRQIMEEGLLDGIDLNNIDVDQEDQISERIAQAYRRRQAERQRERRERRERLAREARSEASPSPSTHSQDLRSPSDRDELSSRRRAHARSESGTSTPQGQTTLRPPVSRPGLIEVANQGPRAHHRRSSSQGSSRSSRRADRPPPLAFNNATLRQADQNDRPRTSESSNSGRRRLSDNQRSSTEDRQQLRNALQAQPSSNPNSPRRSAFNMPASDSPSSSTAIVASPVQSPSPGTAQSSLPPPTSRRTTDPTDVRRPRPPHNGTPPSLSPATFPRSTTEPAATESRSRPNSIVAPAAPVLYPEPQITCNRCSKEHIEYELHYNCSRCDQGQYNLCLSCYRQAKGCKHWFGFGSAAMQRYERQAPPGGYPPNHERPHILVGHRYRKPYIAPAPTENDGNQLLTEDDPAYRLESGVFCDKCKAFANSCYWKCDQCNEGGWGYCNDCVNQGKHCTHPLLPIAHKTKEKAPNHTTTTERTSAPSSPRPETSHLAGPLSPGLAPPFYDCSPTTPPLTPKTASMSRGPGLITIANAIFRPLTFTTICNICTYPIPPSHTRYHCPRCNKGDYDICMSCYHKLVASSRIPREDGMNGWRRCLRAHRTVVVGFQDGEDGQRRIVTRDLVGGHAIKDLDTDTSPRSPTSSTSPAAAAAAANWSWRDTDGSVLSRHHREHAGSPSALPQNVQQQQQRFPPDGGVGLRVLALWSYFPGEGVADELGFPKGAEIREAEDINGDWFWGVYAGEKGLFPGNYGRVVGGG